MARGKKKESALTPEEKLAQALVHDWEQPYKVPKNWSWVNLESVASLHNGDRGVNYPSKKDYVEIGIPFINAGAIQNNALDEAEFNYITEEKFESLRAGKIQKGDILYCLRGSLGKTAVVENDTKGAISSSLCILRCNGAVLRKYFAYLLRADVIYKQQEIAENGSAQPNLSAASVLKYMLPIPPLAEQQRIVDRIEYLFAKLDEAKEKAQSVLDSFETRKAAILHKAFTSELTAKWRDEHGVEGNWITSTVGSVCHEVKVGIVIKPSQYYTDEENGTPAFRSANVRENRIDDFDWVYLNHAGMESNKRSIVHTGDVLVVRSGNPGTACVVSEKFDGYNAIDILIAVPNQNMITSEFLCCYTNSPFGKNLVSENKRGMALAHFNVKGYSGLPIRVPTLEEQREIVRILDSLFAKEQQAKEAAEAVLEKIDLLKKSILARAFRGELGTNDPTEESALELLKEAIR